MSKVKSRIKMALLIGVPFLAVGILWWLSWYLIIRSPSLASWTERAAFGDMFGAVGGFFSGLAFAGIILTVFLQTQELRLQRDAIQQTNRNLNTLCEAQRSTERSMCRLAKAQALTGLLSAPEKFSDMFDPTDIGKTNLEGELKKTIREADRDIARLESLDDPTC